MIYMGVWVAVGMHTHLHAHTHRPLFFFVTYHPQDINQDIAVIILY